MRPGLVQLPSVQDWADAATEPDEDLAAAADLGPDLGGDLGPSTVDAVTVVTGVKHNPMRFGRTSGTKGAAKGGLRASGTRAARGPGARSAKAWAKQGRAKAKGRTDHR